MLPRPADERSYAAPIVDRTSTASPSRKAADDPTTRLAALKARLESDTRARYVVNKNKMDHGPFTAVELLQQVASAVHRSGRRAARDQLDRQMPISEWKNSPFAMQAGLLRDQRAEEEGRRPGRERRQEERPGRPGGERRRCAGRALAVWFFTRRGTRDEDIVVANDRGDAVDVNGDIKGKKRPAGAGGHPGGGGGGYAAGGQSYEAVLNSNNETISMGGGSGAPDLTNAQLSAPLRAASFVSGCGARTT